MRDDGWINVSNLGTALNHCSSWPCHCTRGKSIEMQELNPGRGMYIALQDISPPCLREILENNQFRLLIGETGADRIRKLSGRGAKRKHKDSGHQMLTPPTRPAPIMRYIMPKETGMIERA